MHSSAFTHTKVSKTDKQSAVKVDCHEVDHYQSCSRPRANSLPALTQRLKGTLSRSQRHSSYSSSSSLHSTPASAPSPQTKPHVRFFSGSFPRINLRTLFVARRRTYKPSRNMAGSLDNMEPRKNMLFPDVSTFNDANRVYLDIDDGSIVPSQYPVTGPICEEEPLALDILISARQFDEEEDLSEPEEDDFLLMQEVVLERIDFRL
ncbi:hypothetical protein CPB85DRAFT_1566765 [Mucidula mucida]|nr:hypothetical protein CPB85DRAFT_1566765 [Mucidula mucida]